MTLTVSLPSDREIVITRRFKASRHPIFDAHTKPELLRRWLLGPPGWTMPVCEVDLRAGGAYRYGWRNEADGSIMTLTGVYRHIVVPERIVATQLFEPDWTDGEALCTLHLTELAGVTTLFNTVVYVSPEVRDAALKTDMTDDIEACYQRLDQVVAGAN